MKKIFVLFVLVNVVCCCFAQSIGAATAAGSATATTAVPEITLVNIQASGSNIVDEQLSQYPLSVKCDVKGKENNGITITAEFTLPKDFAGDLGLLLYKNLMYSEIYVNDQYIDTIGRAGEDFFFQPYISRGVLVPRSILKETNTIRFKLWNDTGAYKIRLLKFTDKQTYDNALRIYGFLDIQIPRFACILLSFVMLYCLFMFINYQNRKEFLYLSLASLFFSGYLLNVTIYTAPFSYIKMKAFLYALFPTSVIFVTHFFRAFFQLKTKKHIKFTIDAVGVVFALGYFLQTNTVSLDTWHSLMLSYPFFALGYGIYGVAKSMKVKGIRNVGATIGICLCIMFSGYDMFYFLLDKTPFILLQGLGFMALIVGTFYSVSQEQALADIRCVKFAKELESNQDRQIQIFTLVRNISEKVSASGKNLDDSVEAVSALVTQYIKNVNQIHTNIQTQHDQVRQNKENITKIFDAIGKMSEMVNNHEQLVETTVSDINSLTDGIHKTDELIKKASETTNSLTDVCTVADQDVIKSLNLVDDLANYSKNIYTIVNSISEISEQTNVLSINAAIEAARSGESGKGFSVVANEIRSLASESRENTDKINGILSTMIGKIENIQQQEALVSSRLKKVIAENAKNQDEIYDIYSVLQSQLEKSSRISSTIEDLVATVRTIAEQTHEQKSSGENLNNSLGLLTEITNSVLNASKEQQAYNVDLQDNLDKIRVVSDENIDITNELAQIINW